MKDVILWTGGAVATVLIIAGVALANFDTADADASGAVDLDEFLAAFPGATEDTFMAVDLNADGLVSADEHQRAVDAGLLPAD